VSIQDIPPKIVEATTHTLSYNQWPPQEARTKKQVGGEKGKLVPTPLGQQVLHVMLTHFNELFEYRFTSTMESRLDKVAEGKEAWKTLVKDLWNSYKDKYHALQQDPNSKKERQFSNGIKAVVTKKGPLLFEDKTCIGWPDVVTFEEITEEMIIAYKEQRSAIIGHWGQHPIYKKQGKFGTYLQSNEISIPFIADEELDKTVERFVSKSDNHANKASKSFKSYVVNQGQYGPYIMKKGLKKAQFISIPRDINIDTLTEKDVEALYVNGLKEKKEKANNPKKKF
jgi:DNA topoisomerase-1